MKRLTILICLLLAGNLLIAEERTTLFNRTNQKHTLLLEKVIDDDNETYFYIMTLEQKETEKNYIACYLYLWGNAEETAKILIAELTEVNNYYDYITELELEASKEDVNFLDDQLVYCYYFSIEIE